MKKLLCILTAICILAMTMGSIVMAEGETNLALAQNGAVADAGATYSTYVASNAIDGSTSSIWQAYKSSKYTDMWLKVTLANTATINKIKFYSSVEKNADLWEVSFSLTGEDDSWTTATGLKLTQSTTKPYEYEVLLSSVLAKYVKIVRLGEASTIAISEVEVYGEVTNLPYLKSLTADGGKFTTDFDMNVLSYKLQVEDFESLPDLIYEPYMSDVSAEITQTANASNSYTTEITVTHQSETKKYTVQYVPYNWALYTNGADATGYQTNSALPAINAIDGNKQNGWQSASNTQESGRYLQIELAAPIAVSEISFINTTSQNNWEIHYSLTGEEGSWVKATGLTTVSSSSPYQHKVTLPSVVAQYVKVVRTSECKKIYINEVEVYGKKLTEEYTKSCAISNNTLIGNVAFLNNTQESVNDKYYLMAVYVGGALYDVVPADKSGNTIEAGDAAGTSFTSVALPASGAVTAKLFVWNTPVALVPVITPLTLK